MPLSFCKEESTVIIELTEFLNAVSRATDYVEAEVLDVPKHHVRRVAVLANRMAECAGLDAETPCCTTAPCRSISARSRSTAI